MVIQNSNKSIKPPGSFRGAYSKLNLYFQNAVNCYYKHTSSEFGKELKKQRSIQAEGAFGVIKEDKRFTRRGLANVKMEFLLVCLGYDFKKYHKYRLRETKKQLVN